MTVILKSPIKLAILIIFTYTNSTDATFHLNGVALRISRIYVRIQNFQVSYLIYGYFQVHFKQRESPSILKGWSFVELALLFSSNSGHVKVMTTENI